MSPRRLARAVFVAPFMLAAFFAFVAVIAASDVHAHVFSDPPLRRRALAWPEVPPDGERDWAPLFAQRFKPARRLNATLRRGVTLDALVAAAEPVPQIVVVLEGVLWTPPHMPQNPLAECAHLIGARGRSTWEPEPARYGRGPLTARYPTVLFVVLVGQYHYANVDYYDTAKRDREPALVMLEQQLALNTSGVVVAGDWTMSFAQPLTADTHLPVVRIYDAKHRRHLYTLSGCSAYDLEAFFVALRDPDPDRRAALDAAYARIDAANAENRESDLDLAQQRFPGFDRDAFKIARQP